MFDAWRKANFLWIGPQLSPVEILTLKSHVATGWDVTIYTYGDVVGVPDGCTIREGREVLDDALIFTNQDSDAPGVSFSDFADLFRWRLLSQEPGWWFDMDLVSIAAPRPVPNEAPMRFASSWEHEWGQCAINCVMFSDGTSGLFAEAFDRSMQIVERGEVEYLKIGPRMLQGLVNEKGLDRYVAPWWEFCPYPWRQIKTACSQSTREHIANQLRVVKHTVEAARGADVRPARLRSGTVAVHLHNEIWRKADLAKTGPFSRYSFVGRQMLKHQVPGAIVV